MVFLRTPLLRLIAHSNRTPLRNSQTPHAPITFHTPRSFFSRSFATTTEPSIQKAQAVLLKAPSVDELDPDDEIELLSGDEARLTITERAAEKLRAISTEDQESPLALRIAVESGGCHGYQYKMELTSDLSAEDYQFAHPVVTQSSIVVDAISLGLLKGSTVDYATELIGSSFRVVDNPQAKGSGCGCGVSWEANI